ncbi:acyl-CoA dehydrogenase family protein [Ideonella sp. A 288]|uniref:acyl-CoA dehydrogenase family protein n=1 Tax=Ideonella sp. A 288 TaxID=1962181 RepID=UPI000B4AB82D|nr:acyl-CoA dehydrogenase family protein [Ideonella sp. A 288]
MRELFESSLSRLLADQVTPAVWAACDAGEWPTGLWAALQTSGFAVAAAPESCGGAGASWADLFVVLRAAGAHALPAPLPETMLANAVLGHCGLAAVNAPLGLAASGQLRLSDDGLASGTLHGVPWGRHVGQVVAVAGGPRPTLLLLDRRQATLERRQNIAGEPRDDLHFDAVAPDATAVLPPGLPADLLWLGGALLRSAQTAGALQRVLDLSTRHATERVQFGKPIGAFQAIAHQLAVLCEHTAACTVAAECAFAESADGASGFAAWPIAAAKVCSADAAGAAAAIAHAVHGAMGFTHEHALHRCTRRLWSWRSEFGHATHWAQRLGRAVCAGGAAALWPTLTSITAGGAGLPLDTDPTEPDRP